MLILNRLGGFGVGRAVEAGPALVYINSNGTGTLSSTFDFGSFVAPKAGLLIVGAISNGPPSALLSAASIGGTNGTIHTQDANARSAIASREVGAGTHNVTLTYAGSKASASCHVWLLTGYTSAIPVAATNNVIAGETITTTLTIPAGGIAVYVGSAISPTGSAGWSSATKRYDQTLGSGPSTVSHTAADKTTETELLNHPETVSWSAANGVAAAGAVWS